MKYPSDKYPKISVIMPVLNRVATTEKAILSLISQNYPNVEFLVLDAASTDGTLEVLNRYKEYISYIRSHKDKGNADALNEGISNATGDIISILCSDDFFEKDALIRVGEAFIENPDVDIVNVLGRVVAEDRSGKLISGHETTVEEMPISNGNVRVLHPNCRFIKKGLFDKYGLAISEINGEPAWASDYELITRLSLYDPKNITLDFVGYNYLGHEGSLTFNNNKYTKLKLGDQKVYYIEQLLKNHSAVIGSALRTRFNKEYRIAFTRRVTKNLVDGNYRLALVNLKEGVRKSGWIFPFKVMRYYISYKVRLNKLLKG